MIDRRDFIRRGALWTLGATLVTPELLDRLTWKRRLWPGADFGPRWPSFVEVRTENGYVLRAPYTQWEEQPSGNLSRNARVAFDLTGGAVVAFREEGDEWNELATPMKYDFQVWSHHHRRVTAATP